MPRNGSGTYSLPASSWNPATTGTTIESSAANTTLSDIASALTQSLSKDGQTTPTGNIPMGGFKITNLGDGAASTDAMAYGQGAKLSGGNTFSGAQVINGSVSLSGSLSVTGPAIFTSSVTIDNLSVGSSIVVGTASGGSKGISTINAGGYYLGGAQLHPVIQVVTTQTGAVATGSTIIPVDDTIPQITEGVQFLSVSITPKNASSTLVIEILLNVSSSFAPTGATVALFQDATANALAAATASFTTTNEVHPLPLRYKMTAGTTSATTFTARAGISNAGNLTVNGQSGSRFFGGVYFSSITITEYAP